MGLARVVVVLVQTAGFIRAMVAGTRGAIAARTGGFLVTDAFPGTSFAFSQMDAQVMVVENIARFESPVSADLFCDGGRILAQCPGDVDLV